mmetsp:Transcript_46296/g.86456  ORF Transcript_46296/g.86456 Transcript_46296/m.86456 type:complete len:154 (+) Transcript_46296:84-545(+)
MEFPCPWLATMVVLLLIPQGLCLEASTHESQTHGAASLAISADGSVQGSLVRNQKWWAPKAPPDENRPQPLAHTGTINPLSCYDTLVKANVPCFDFGKVACKPWQSTECQCDDKNPVCVTDIAERSSSASPADARSALAMQYACCPKPPPELE